MMTVPITVIPLIVTWAKHKNVSLNLCISWRWQQMSVEVDWCLRGVYCLYHQGDHALWPWEPEISLSIFAQYKYRILFTLTLLFGCARGLLYFVTSVWALPAASLQSFAILQNKNINITVMLWYVKYVNGTDYGYTKARILDRTHKPIFLCTDLQILSC